MDNISDLILVRRAGQQARLGHRGATLSSNSLLEPGPGALGSREVPPVPLRRPSFVCRRRFLPTDIAPPGVRAGRVIRSASVHPGGNHRPDIDRGQLERVLQQLATVDVVEIVVETVGITCDYQPHHPLPVLHQPSQAVRDDRVGLTLLAQKVADRIVVEFGHCWTGALRRRPSGSAKGCWLGPRRARPRAGQLLP